MKKYLICNYGCDDGTEFEIELTEEQTKFLVKVFEENKRLRKDYGRLMQDNAYTLELEQELERYKNIIDELERYIKTDAKIEIYGDKTGLRTFVDGQDLLNKLKELKGSDN